MTAWAVVREARHRAGLTQRELAARAGKAQSEIAKIERGRREPTFATVERLVRAAGFDLRIHLTPHDDHDEVLIDEVLRMTLEERLTALEAEDELFAAAVDVGL